MTNQHTTIVGDESLRELLAPITHFLSVDGITDVFVNEPNIVITKNDLGRQKHKVEGLGYDELMQIGTTVGNYSLQSISAQSPIISATLPDGERIQIVIPPVVCKGSISISIRKPMPQVKTMAEYQTEGLFKETSWLNKSMTDHALFHQLDNDNQHLTNLLLEHRLSEFFIAAVHLRKTIAVVGATGSGKTTFMKMLCQAIPLHEALITIEDARELFLPHHPFVTHLTYSKGGQGQAKVTPADLIHSTMRMNPDRVLLAELRGSESYDYLKLLTSGHAGSITSWHASSPEEALVRFVLMAKEHPEAAAYQDIALKRLLFTSIDIIAHLDSSPILDQQNGQIGTLRKMTGIYYNPVKKLELALET